MLAVEIPFLAFVKKVGKDAHVPRVSVIIGFVVKLLHVLYL